MSIAAGGAERKADHVGTANRLSGGLRDQGGNVAIVGLCSTGNEGKGCGLLSGELRCVLLSAGWQSYAFNGNVKKVANIWHIRPNGFLARKILLYINLDSMLH